MRRPTAKFVARAEDMIEKVSGQTDRAGHFSARIDRALNRGTGRDALAVQVNANNPEEQPFTGADISVLQRGYRVNKSKSALTAAQTEDLMDVAEGRLGLDSNLVAKPA